MQALNLQELTAKRYITLTNRGNNAILQALKAAKALGYEEVCYPDQGAWYRYPQLIKQANLIPKQLTTQDGYLVAPPVSNTVALICTSMIAYTYPQHMTTLAEHCKTNHSLLINDASGSIGTPLATIGDIIVISFGKHKPVSAGTGGCIVTNDAILAQHFSQTLAETTLPAVHEAIRTLPATLNYWHQIKNKIIKELSNHVLHAHPQGINIIAAKEAKPYCDKNQYPYTTCPREIRLLKDALCIEIKQLRKEL